jgi:hypothetical protein
MTFCALTFALLAASAAAAAPRGAALTSSYTYDAYLQHFKKTETTASRELFTRNLAAILKHNSNPNRKFTMGLNQFTDEEPPKGRKAPVKGGAKKHQKSECTRPGGGMFDPETYKPSTKGDKKKGKGKGKDKDKDQKPSKPPGAGKGKEEEAKPDGKGPKKDGDPNAKAKFDAADKAGSGMVSYEVFQDALASEDMDLNDQVLITLMRRFDLNKDGNIAYVDLLGIGA